MGAFDLNARLIQAHTEFSDRCFQKRKINMGFSEADMEMWKGLPPMLQPEPLLHHQCVLEQVQSEARSPVERR